MRSMSGYKKLPKGGGGGGAGQKQWKNESEETDHSGKRDRGHAPGILWKELNGLWAFAT